MQIHDAPQAPALNILQGQHQKQLPASITAWCQT